MRLFDIFKRSAEQLVKPSDKNTNKHVIATGVSISEPALEERMSKVSVPIQLFSVEECVSIVFFEWDENKEALNQLYAKAKKSFVQKYPQIKI